MERYIELIRFNGLRHILYTNVKLMEVWAIFKFTRVIYIKYKMIIRLYNYKSIFLLPVKHRVYRVKNYTVKTKYYLLCIREWCDISHRARIMCVKCEDACSWFYHVFTYNRAGNCKEFYHDRRWKRIKETCAACCCQPRRGVSAVKKKRRYHRRRKRQGWEDVYESVIASILAGSLSRATDSTLDVSVLTYKATFSRFSCREIYFDIQIISLSTN